MRRAGQKERTSDSCNWCRDSIYDLVGCVGLINSESWNHFSFFGPMSHFALLSLLLSLLSRH